MVIEAESQQQRDDLKKRVELQAKLQEAIRRSASETELRRIQLQIEEHNKKLEAYQSHSKKGTGT